MTWEENLRAAAVDLGARLEHRHVHAPIRRRFRPLAGAALALLVAAAAFAAWPRDSASDIGSLYAGQMIEVRIDDPGRRREFESALAHVERAIALANDAVRRSPRNAEFTRLCHVAYQAKVRLIQAYSTGG